MLSAIGLAGGLALLILLTVRGVNIIVAGVACAAVVAATSGIPMLPALAGAGEPDFVTTYMDGFTRFFAALFFLFLFGAIFGEVMSKTGLADSVAHWIVERFGARAAALAVVAAAAILTYGGVSVFIVAFSVYPMALSLFKRANLPRRFIPAVLAFGSVTFTMTSAGSPEIQNIIPSEVLCDLGPEACTTPYAGWRVSLFVAILMAGLGVLWLRRMMNRAVARGEAFDARDGDPEERDYASLPSPILSLLPLAAVLGVFFMFEHPEFGWGPLDLVIPDDRETKSSLLVALGSGIVVAMLVGLRSLRLMPAAFSAGAAGSVIAITNTCAVVGFGEVAKGTPAFDVAVAAMTGLPGDPLIGAAVAVTVIAGLTGSASGGQYIALPLIAPGYIDAGVNPPELHRVVAIASGALDSLPHNGYVVTTIRAICGETHKAAYGPLAALTVVTPLLGLAIAIALFILT